MILKVFTQPNCPKCPPAKQLAANLKDKNKELNVETYDTSTVDGMAEGAFYQVMSTPTILLTDDGGKIVGQWRGVVPKESEIISKIRDF